MTIMVIMMWELSEAESKCSVWPSLHYHRGDECLMVFLPPLYFSSTVGKEEKREKEKMFNSF